MEDSPFGFGAGNPRALADLPGLEIFGFVAGCSHPSGTGRGSMAEKHRWEFRPRFRRGAFGWRSQPAEKRVKEAVAEVKKMARTDPALAAEGAVLFLERVSPALEHVDSSSGALGTAVNRAVEALVPIIATAPITQRRRAALLERLFEALQDDDPPYIETLAEHWGELCASPALASKWADDLMGIVRLSWSPDPKLRGYFKGTSACLSALLAAGRHQELLDLLEAAPHAWWHYRRYGVMALVAMGHKAQALRYAEASRSRYDPDGPIDRACEEILLSSGLVEEAYQRYGRKGALRSTYLATFRDRVRRYPHLPPETILRDLVASTPGKEGKWFAAAKEAGLLDLALELAAASPTDPLTLSRAARDFAEENPAFAVEAGFAALRWLVEGYGYEITGAHVWVAYHRTLAAAEALGRREEVRGRIRALVATEASGERFVSTVLGRELGLP
jgi:hypothetical protein